MKKPQQTLADLQEKAVDIKAIAQAVVAKLSEAIAADTDAEFRAKLAKAALNTGALYSTLADLELATNACAPAKLDQIEVTLRVDQADDLRRGCIRSDTTIDEAVAGCLVSQGLVKP